MRIFLPTLHSQILIDHKSLFLTMPNELIFDPEWLEVKQKLSRRFGKVPDLNAILMIIGIQRLGKVLPEYTKEQKQDLMHVGVCTLLEEEGFYRFEGLDDDGWPHFVAEKPLPKMTVEQQEEMLMSKVIDYLKQIEL